MKVFLLLIATLLFIPTPALASCLPPPPIPERKERADFVVVGQVVSTSGFGSNSATIKVEKYYKGESADRINVRGGPEGVAATSIDMEFEVGKKYLLFLKMEENKLSTDDCVGNIKLEGELNTEQLAALGEGQEPTSRASTDPNPAVIGAIVAVGFLILKRFSI